MAYTDGKAAPKHSSSGVLSPASAPSRDSNQARTQGQAAKFSQPSIAPNASVGNQVRIGGNTKGTGVAGRPSSVAVGGKDKKFPAVENPTGSRSGK